MPARWATCVTPSRSADQSLCCARSGMATRSTPFAAGIAARSRAAALTSHPSLARAVVKRLPINPEAPVTSTRPFISTAFGQSEQQQAGGQQTESKAEEIDSRRPGQNGGDRQADEQSLKGEHTR